MTKFVRQNVVIFFLCIFICMGCDSNRMEYVLSTETEATTESVSEEVVATYVVVHVCGEVRKPGVYTLPEGARICDAISQAQGYTQAACETYWNMAKLLEDGQMIYVPTKEEALQMKVEETEVKESRVNINTADCALLMTIPGVGESRAKQIIAYREENGDFSTIEDIMKVTGIKDALFQKMKEYIRTE